MGRNRKYHVTRVRPRPTVHKAEVNSDVTERHRADKKSILFAQVRPADCIPRSAHALKFYNDEISARGGQRM